MGCFCFCFAFTSLLFLHGKYVAIPQVIYNIYNLYQYKSSKETQVQTLVQFFVLRNVGVLVCDFEIFSQFRRTYKEATGSGPWATYSGILFLQWPVSSIWQHSIFLHLYFWTDLKITQVNASCAVKGKTVLNLIIFLLFSIFNIALCLTIQNRKLSLFSSCSIKKWITSWNHISLQLFNFFSV